MFRTALDLMEMIISITPFLFSLLALTVLSIALSKSIKRHAKVYYWIVGTLCLGFAIPVMGRFFGISLPSISSIPVLGTIASEISNAAYFLHPMLVIIMFMGAFSPKNRYIGRLMTIRTELSILVGFPFFAHIAKRLFFTFPRSWSFLMNYEESISNPRVVSVAGATIEHSVFVLGVVMTALFLVLWITSLGSVRRSMGQRKWKSVQRWSYALYAMLFIHSMGIQIGNLMNYNATQEIAALKAQQTELVASIAISGNNEQASAQTNTKVESQNKQSQQKVQDSKERKKPFSLEDVKPNRGTRAKINMTIYILIYGSYLFFRLRKARRDKRKRLDRDAKRVDNQN